MDDSLTLEELLEWLVKSEKTGIYNGFTRYEITLYILARFYNK